MEKILLPVNASQASTHVIDFACYIANLTHSELTGVFPASLPVPRTAGEEWTEVCLQNRRFFESACQNRGVNGRVEYIKTTTADAVIGESRFAHVVILDPEMSPGEQTEEIPTSFTRSVIAGSECPVVVAPYSFDAVEEVILAYGGGRASVAAIKQFAGLFPGLTTKKLILLHVAEKGSLPQWEREKLGNMLGTQFAQVQIEELPGKVAETLMGYLLKKRNAFLVMGAYGRTLLGVTARSSPVSLLLKTINLPVFISHY